VIILWVVIGSLVVAGIAFTIHDRRTDAVVRHARKRDELEKRLGPLTDRVYLDMCFWLAAGPPEHQEAIEAALDQFAPQADLSGG
jgi:hypothetical protein